MVRLPVRVALIELAAWLMLPAAFLAICVSSSWLPSSAIVPHLRVVGLLALAVITLRMFLARALQRPAWRRWVVAFAIAVVLSLLILYYTLVLLGFAAWGRVVSWPLIRTYGAELPALVETQGYSMTLVVAGLLAVFMAMVAAVRALLVRADWVTALAGRVTLNVWVALAAGGAAAVALLVWGFVAAPWTDAREPVSLTFFPEQASRDMQGHALDRLKLERLDAEEDAAWRSYTVHRVERPTNVVLIVVDALRPDHLGPYGYHRPTTPFLSELDRAGRLRRVDAVHSSCGDSSCGLLSMASSRFLHQIPTRPITLQQVLRRSGYRVHMILSGDHTNFYGLRETYGDVDSYHDGATTTTRYMNDDRLVVDRIESLPRWDGTPTMFQFHLMSSHVLGRRQNSTAPFPPGHNYSVVGRRFKPAEGHGADEAAIDYYDNGVAQTDQFLREIRRLLSEKGYLDRALIVITADHGEALGEHGRYVHANDVHEQAIRIPLLFEAVGYEAPPFPAARRHATQVDIAPTVLRELGLPAPSTWTGRPLHEEKGLELAWFQQSGRSGVLDLRDPPHLWKYWIDLRTKKERVFDVSIDPMEQDDMLNRVDRSRLAQWRVQAVANATNEHASSGH